MSALSKVMPNIASAAAGGEYGTMFDYDAPTGATIDLSRQFLPPSTEPGGDWIQNSSERGGDGSVDDGEWFNVYHPSHFPDDEPQKKLQAKKKGAKKMNKLPSLTSGFSPAPVRKQDKAGNATQAKTPKGFGKRSDRKKKTPLRYRHRN